MRETFYKISASEYAGVKNEIERLNNELRMYKIGHHRKEYLELLDANNELHDDIMELKTQLDMERAESARKAKEISNLKSTLQLVNSQLSQIEKEIKMRTGYGIPTLTIGDFIDTNA